MVESIEKMYVDSEKPGAFTGPRNFASVNKLPLKRVLNALKSVEAYRRHAKANRKIKRRPYVFTSMDEIWGMDLAAVPHPKSNYNKRWVLCCVDGLSKMAFLEPLKSKHAEEVISGIERIKNRTGRSPKMLEFDKAKEFLSAKVKVFCAKNGIRTFTVNGIAKIAIIERLILTIFRMIERYKTQYNTKRFIHKLHDFERIYNNSYHSSIKRKPIDVTKENEMEVFDTLYKNHYPRKGSKKLDIVIGTKVLRKVDKTLFEKGRKPTFRAEIYSVDSIKATNPVTFLIRDEEGTLLKRPYYREELFVI